MSFYQSKGLIPNKRHTVFKKDADSIYYEEYLPDARGAQMNI